MRILIAGFGSIGRRHFQNLLALGERDICLYRTHHSTLPDQELAGFTVESDLEAALARQPQAVIISNPTALHLNVAIPAAEAGCHLFLEKPISHSLERVDKLSDAVKRGGGQVYVGYQFRFHPGLQHARRLLADGAIGQPLSARAHWGEYLPGWHPWEDYRHGYSARADLGGGVVLTLCHPIDYLRWLLGEVSEVWAFTGQLSELELDVEDVAEIGLRFVDGAIGSVHLDYVQRPPAHRLEIIGAKGSLQLDFTSGDTRIFRAETNKEPRWEIYPAPPGFERNDLFMAQMRHFLEVAKGIALPACTLQDGVSALEIALAAHRSQNQGKSIHMQADIQPMRKKLI
jgi:predicted dehydrogenase